MRSAGDNVTHQQSAEYVTSLLQSLCDQVFYTSNAHCVLTHYGQNIKLGYPQVPAFVRFFLFLKGEKNNIFKIQKVKDCVWLAALADFLPVFLFLNVIL